MRFSRIAYAKPSSAGQLGKQAPQSWPLCTVCGRTTTSSCCAHGAMENPYPRPLDPGPWPLYPESSCCTQVAVEES